jgi:aryl sulfotransferase
MAKPGIVWPQKQRDIHNHHMDSTRWNDFRFRDDDIVIGTWAKSGTTWMQQIIAQLTSNGSNTDFAFMDSPWLDLRVMPKEEVFKQLEAQQHRRFVKTHLPVDALVFSPQAKYIYIARDIRDVVWSMHHHHIHFTPQAYEMFNNTPGLVGPPLGPPNPDIRAYYHEFLDTDAGQFWPFWSNVQSWWNIRELPNVLLVHFNNLRANTKDEISRIADFLDIPVDAAAWPQILEHCSLDYMKQQAAKVEMMDAVFQGGGGNFVNKGTNGRWKDVLTPAEVQKADEVAARNLTPDCAHWLKTGELKSIVPIWP